MSMSLNKSEIIAELKAVALDKTQNDQERARRVLFVLPGACTISDVIQLIGRLFKKAKSCRSQCFDTTFTIPVVIIVVVIFFLLDFSFNVFYRVTPFQQAQTVYTKSSKLKFSRLCHYTSCNYRKN